MIQNTHWKQLARNWASILFGNALYSLAVALFLEPSGLITGGATGIALAIGRLTGLPVSGLLLFINLAMLVWGWAVWPGLCPQHSGQQRPQPGLSRPL